MNVSAQPLSAIDFAGIRREHAELTDVLNARVAEVMASGQMLQGPGVEALERSLAQACGRAAAVCVGSGTDALYFALLAVGVGAGHEVIVPDISFIATAAAVARTGAQPVFVDVDDGCLLDLEAAGKAVTPRTKAVVMVQLFGAMGDPANLRAFAAAHGLSIVEDAAQAFGAAHGEAPAGSVGHKPALGLVRKAVAVDVDTFQQLVRELSSRPLGADDGDGPAGVPQGQGLLPNVSIKRDRKVLDDDHAGATTLNERPGHTLVPAGLKRLPWPQASAWQVASGSSMPG